MIVLNMKAKIIKLFSVRRNILLIIALAAVLSSIFLGVILYNTSLSGSTDFMVTQTYHVMKQVESVRSGVAETELAVKEYIFSRDETVKKDIQIEQARLIKGVNEAAELSKDSSQRKKILELQLLLQQKIKQQLATINVVDKITKQEIPGKYFNEDQALTQLIFKKEEQIMQDERLLLQERIQLSSKAAKRISIFVITGALFIFLFFAALVWLFYQGIVSSINAEKKSKESELKYSKLVEGTGRVIITTNLNGCFEFVSSRVKILTGYEAEELLGQSFDKLVPAPWQKKVSKNFEKQIRSGIAEQTMQFPIITIDGNEKWVKSVSVIIYIDNIPSGFQCTIKDITADVEVESKLKRSEELAQTLLNSTNEGFFMVDRDMFIKVLNKRAKEGMSLRLGVNVELGMNLLAITNDELRDIMKENFDRVFNGETIEFETKFNTPAGMQWIRISHSPVIEPNGQITGAAVVTSDITSIKLNEEKVRAANQKINDEREGYQFRLQSILDYTPLIIFIKDLNGKYLLINRSFREAFMVTDEEVIDKTDFDFDLPEAAQRYKEADEQVVATLKVIQTEEKVFLFGEERHLLIVKFPLFNKENKLYGVGAIANDITERVQSNKKLIDAKRKAESAEQLQEQFLASMSHEIRTPLNGIIGMTNVLMNTVLTEEQNEFAQIILKSSDNLLMLINDILDLSKIKAGKVTVEKIEFNLPGLIDTAVAPFRLKAKEKNIRLSVMQDPSLPAQVKSDPLRLTQILTNLLSNAMKFTEEGSIELTVKEMKRDKQEVFICFSIIDSGIGIANEKLNHVFENFEQAAIETTRKYGGTGLGLSITKKLCEIMNGSIEVSSVQNEGTTFRVVLPMQIGDTVTGEKPVLQKDKFNNSDLAGKRILIAEDNDINQKVIMHILRKVGVVTTIVNNGKEAVDLLEEGEQFDLIILDIQMPLMNGFQTAIYIRKKLQISVPIIAMTASALRNEKMKCFELGMNEYLTKPFVPADLYAELRRFLLAQPVAAKNEMSLIKKQGTEFYNLSHLYEMDDNEYFCEVLQLFLDITPVMLDEIKEATLFENWEQVYQIAHKMKSSLGILQMNLMLGLITAIEQQAKEQKKTERIPDGLKRASEIFDLIRPMIKAELETALQASP